MLGSGVPISTGFDLKSNSPLDNRTLVKTKDDLNSMNKSNIPSGLHCYVEFEKQEYRWDGKNWILFNLPNFLNGNGIPDINTGVPGDRYIDTANGILYVKEYTVENGSYWKELANLKGLPGDKGNPGDKGKDGSVWYSTNGGMSGENKIGVIFPNSGIKSAKEGDFCLDNITGNVYQCIKAGASTLSEWKYETCIMGKNAPKNRIIHICTFSEDGKISDSEYSNDFTSSLIGDIAIDPSDKNTKGIWICIEAGDKNSSKWVSLIKM